VSLTRSEIEEFWGSWLDINRTAEQSGDWRVMAEWYAEDATYGWMLTPDEHFMAVGRDQIRDWAAAGSASSGSRTATSSSPGSATGSTSARWRTRWARS